MSPESSERSPQERRKIAGRNGGLLVLLGAAIVIAGGVIPGLSDYVRSIFATVGTAVGLIGPLSIGERFLTIRVEKAADAAVAARSTAGEALETARSVRDAVTNLEGEVRERLTQIHLDEEQQQQAAEEGAQEKFADMYREVADDGWIASRGLRVPTKIDDLSLRVQMVKANPDSKATTSIELAFERPNLDQIGDTIVWLPDEKGVDISERLAGVLKKANLYPGVDSFSRSDLVAVAARTVAKVRDLHIGSRGAIDVGPVVELIDDDWAITTGGVRSLRTDMYAKRDDVQYSTDLTARHIEDNLRANGLDPGSFATVSTHAKQVYEGLKDEERAPFRDFKLD